MSDIDQDSAGLTAVRAAASLVMLLVGLAAFGALYGTEDLVAQLIAFLAFVPFVGFYLLRTSEHLTPKSWTLTVQFLCGLAFPMAAVGVRSWWLLLAGDRLTGCVVDDVTETEDNRGLRYDHDILCGPDELHYTSRGDPEGHRGQALDMLVDPNGLLAPMPAHVAPGGFAWITAVVVGAALVVAVAEPLRRLRTAD